MNNMSNSIKTCYDIIIYFIFYTGDYSFVSRLCFIILHLGFYIWRLCSCLSLLFIFYVDNDRMMKQLCYLTRCAFFTSCLYKSL